MKKHFNIWGRRIFPGENSVQYRGRTTKLEPRLTSLLMMLHQSKGKVVSKEEIMSHVWCDSIVTEDSLTKAISRLRQTLGDPDARIIETVRSVGYRLRKPGGIRLVLTRLRKNAALLVILFLLYILFGSGLVTWILGLPVG